MMSVYHSMGSMTDVPHSVAVEMEKNSILRKSSIGDDTLLSDTLLHPGGYVERFQQSSKEEMPYI